MSNYNNPLDKIMGNERKKVVKRVATKKYVIKEGPRGGKYYTTNNGSKVYITKSIGKTLK